MLSYVTLCSLSRLTSKLLWCWLNDGCIQCVRLRWKPSYNRICPVNSVNLVSVCVFESYATHAHTHANRVVDFSWNYVVLDFLFRLIHSFYILSFEFITQKGIHITYGTRYRQNVAYVCECECETVMPYEKFTTTQSNRP